MSMSKQDFVALADAIKSELCGFRQVYQVYDANTPPVTVQKVVEVLADFCERQNPAFKRQRWLDYIAGKCGPNSGAVKKGKV